MRIPYLYLSIFWLIFQTAYSQPKESYVVKNLAFPTNATIAEKIKMASHLIPSPQQYACHQMELTAFLHFGINTFTDREWGEGNESPSVFAPTDFNPEQWVIALKKAGFKMAILTAKHHDGFCLWPTQTTNHSVRFSPWKEGKGDVVKELREACKKHNLKFGVYLSPWDRNASCYGNSAVYNEFFNKQLTELLTNYGEIHEVWFDGACGEGPNGKKQVYDWPKFYQTIRRLQPNAVIAIMGDDVRWVGNERGLGRETEWSVTPLVPGIYDRASQQNDRLKINGLTKDLGSRALLEKASEIFWYPSEVDVSIRPGWFYHESQNDQVKSLAELSKIYFESVGYNSVLLLNIPPDTRGHIHEKDVERLQEFATYLKQTFKHNYLSKPYKGSIPLNQPLEIKLKKKALLNTFLIQEDILKGQRIEQFLLEGLIDNQWKELYRGTTVGYKRLVRFEDNTLSKLRLTILQARDTVNILNMGAFFAPAITPNSKSHPQKEVSKQTWTPFQMNVDAQKAFDNQENTFWYAQSLTPLTIDLGISTGFKGFSYTPRQQQEASGTITRYRFSTSMDGKTWTTIIEQGEFSNIKNNPIKQEVLFKKVVKARYLKLESLEEIHNKNEISVAEVSIIP